MITLGPRLHFKANFQVLKRAIDLRRKILSPLIECVKSQTKIQVSLNNAKSCTMEKQKQTLGKHS